MKGKMLIAMAVSSMLAATLVYADPVSTDNDLSDDAQAQLTDNGNGMSGTTGMSGMSGMSGTSGMSGSSSMSGTSGPSSSMSGTPTPGASGNDEMNADTATGDDDY